MFFENSEVRLELKKHGVRQWELAEKIGVAESTLCRKMRRELTSSEQDHLIGEIHRIAEYKEYRRELEV